MKRITTSILCSAARGSIGALILACLLWLSPATSAQTNTVSPQCVQVGGTITTNFNVTLLLAGTIANAQTTAFTYQGKLTDNNGLLLTGQYDFQFKLLDTATVGTGTQFGAAQTLSNVAVTNGVFTVQIDFGACDGCFNGAARFLEIAVRPNGGGSFTTLAPRQPFTSAPYAIKTVNLTFNGPYNDGGGLVFAASNTFAGEGAGLNTTPTSNVANVPGKWNPFFGAGAGQASTSGSANSFFGLGAGLNSTSSSNSFFGAEAGIQNTTGSQNAFFGQGAGKFNTTGGQNVFVGQAAGLSNTTSSGNAFFGRSAGAENTTGSQNVFIGQFAGGFNTIGQRNTFLGSSADFLPNNTGDYNTLLGSLTKINGSLSNATAIGAQASVTQSNSLVLGSINGVNNATADTNVGIGTTAPATRLHVSGTSIVRARVNSDSNAGLALTLNNQAGWSQATVTGGQFQIFNDANPFNADWIDSTTNNVGIGNTSPADRLQVGGELRVNACVKNSGGTAIAGTCPSDMRFKRDITPFPDLLDKLVRLRPVNYYWRSAEYPDKHFGSGPSYGLIAQEVEQVLPELVSTDEQGYKAVNYSKLPLLAIQAIKELKTESDALKQENAAIRLESASIRQQQQALQAQIDALKKVVCQSAPTADFCRR